MRTRPTRSALRRASLGLVAMTAALLLAGCGRIHPGEAAQVGDTSISRSSLDTVVAAQCQLAAASGGQQGQQIARSQLARQILAALVESRVQLDYADAMDLSYDDAKLRTFLAQLPKQLKALDTERREAFIGANEQVLRGQLVLQATGLKSLAATQTTRQQPTSEQATAAGAKVIQTWADKQGLSVSTDPRYGLTWDGLKSKTRDGSVSRPVSTFAKQSVAQQPDTEFVSGLPRSQSC